MLEVRGISAHSGADCDTGDTRASSRLGGRTAGWIPGADGVSIQLVGGDVGGIGVHLGAQMSVLAGVGEVLVYRTAVALVFGSGLEFDDRGEHQLKGVPGSWRLYAAEL